MQRYRMLSGERMAGLVCRLDLGGLVRVLAIRRFW
jgi:hypothetical protein